MELYILSSVTLSVTLFIVALILFFKNKNQSTQLKDFEDSIKRLSAENQYQEIELAKLNERLSHLSIVELKLIELKDEIKTKETENQELKIDISKLNQQLIEQKEKYNELKQSSKQRLDEIKKELEQSKNINQKYNEEIKNNKSLISQLKTQLKEQHKSMEEKLKLLQDSKEKLKIEFENLANKIFTDSSKKFKEQSQESLGHILNPMKQQLAEFKRRVEDIYDKESKDRSALANELKTLQELNQKMSKEASNLTNALKHDNKTQGGWGEMVLDKVLENSGLREGHEFTKQVSLRDNKNRLFQPDVIVNLPDNRHIIIDAKTSLLAYNEYIASDTKIDKQLHLKNHIKSIKTHIKELSNKNYENLQNINSLDFVFMFIPIENALHLALENDLSLYDEAFKQKIILVSPTTLLVALRAVENTWRYEKQAQSITDVYKRTEELYKKFVGFIDDLKKVDKGLDIAKSSYDEAFKKLSSGRGNLISQVTMLKKVSNIEPKKELDSNLVDKAMMDALEDKR